LRFLIMGDQHFDNNTIKTRKDNVLAACSDKLGQIFQIAKSYGCEAILQPGDFFESHKANDFLKQYIISFLKSDVLAKIPIYTVFGQHDLRYHSSNINNTPLKVLESAGVVNILNNKPLVRLEEDTRLKYRILCLQDMIFIYGQSWYEDTPKPDPELKGIHILVLHKMIVDTKIWEGQEDHTYGKILLKKNDFDLIVSGDNHQHFIMHDGSGSSIGKKLLINCGSLLRTRIDQEDHAPCVYIYNTKPKKGEPVIEQVYLVIDDFKNVIRIEEATKIKEENEKLKEFVNALSIDTQLTGINYRKNIRNYVTQNVKEIDPSMQVFIELVFERLGGKA
jgi:DNA repair exonuclease SbcCD nuclease subunit